MRAGEWKKGEGKSISLAYKKTPPNANTTFLGRAASAALERGDKKRREDKEIRK